VITSDQRLIGKQLGMITSGDDLIAACLRVLVGDEGLVESNPMAIPESKI
jgi:hypothetical protein